MHGSGLGDRSASGQAAFGPARAASRHRRHHSHRPALHCPRCCHHREQAHLHDEENYEDTETEVIRHHLDHGKGARICTTLVFSLYTYPLAIESPIYTQLGRMAVTFIYGFSWECVETPAVTPGYILETALNMVNACHNNIAELARLKWSV